MINPIPTWREGGWVLFRIKDSLVVVFMNQMLKNCNRSTPITSKIGHKNRKERKYFRNQTEIKLKCFQQASNYNGYVTECRRSLSNQNVIDLIQIISAFVTFTYWHNPYHNDIFWNFLYLSNIKLRKSKTKHCVESVGLRTGYVMCSISLC